MIQGGGTILRPAINKCYLFYSTLYQDELPKQKKELINVNIHKKYQN